MSNKKNTSTTTASLARRPSRSASTKKISYKESDGEEDEEVALSRRKTTILKSDDEFSASAAEGEEVVAKKESKREKPQQEQEEDDEEDVEVEAKEATKKKQKKKQGVKKVAKKEKDDEEDVDDQEEELPAATKKKKKVALKSKSNSNSELLKLDKWKISSGERVATATGELRLNPSITTVAFEPILANQKEFAKIVSWNVNGLRSVLEKSSIKRWILEEDPDIICLQETKTNPKKKKDGIPDLAEVAPGFTAYWVHAEKPGYSGVATLTKVAPLSVKLGIGHPELDQEGRTVTLEFDKFFLVNSYWPNAGDKLVKLEKRRSWNKMFHTFVGSLSHKHVVIAGDLNVAPHPVDLHNPKGNLKSAGFSKEERDDFLALVSEHKLIDTWRLHNPVEDVNKTHGLEGMYTYWGFRNNAREANRGWRVDHVLVSEGMSKMVEKAFIRRELLGSDHTAVGILMHRDMLERKD